MQRNLKKYDVPPLTNRITSRLGCLQDGWHQTKPLPWWWTVNDCHTLLLIQLTLHCQRMRENYRRALCRLQNCYDILIWLAYCDMDKRLRVVGSSSESVVKAMWIFRKIFLATDTSGGIRGNNNNMNQCNSANQASEIQNSSFLTANSIPFHFGPNFPIWIMSFTVSLWMPVMRQNSEDDALWPWD